MKRGRTALAWLQRGLILAGGLPALHMLYRVTLALRPGGPGLGKPVIENVAQGSGRWALYFLLLSLAITPVRRVFSLHWLARFRRTLGLLAFFYAGLHAATWLLDRGRHSALSLAQSILSDVAQRPYIALGAAAFFGLVPLAVTSTRAMIRRLGPAWQRLHRLVYGVSLLAVLHFVWRAEQDAWSAVLCGMIWLASMALRLVFWARDVQRAWSEDSDAT
ncbi:MAG: sulfoxide reductase heme-binding subunit YedZ [Myxococcales bacterium]|nr:sulfoxide reductase heme-binding subunit YedZ [Myxococcales bacterium]